ncbi:MAG: hypothetical protein Q8M37_11065 [Nevskia sp.]|nr:hypothetical protein [Nevskia sp.]
MLGALQGGQSPPQQQNQKHSQSNIKSPSHTGESRYPGLHTRASRLWIPAFTWTDGEGKPVAGTTIWSIGSAQGEQFAPSAASFMINYRVDDLLALVKVLREEGCNVLEKVDDSEYGKFAWVIDPEGNKVELWQPPAGQ